MAYSKRFPGGFVDLPSQITDIDSQFLNGVETSLLRVDAVDPSTDGQVLQWASATSKYGAALILDKNIDPAAAISKSKLNLAGQIANVDVAGSAAIVRSKLDFGTGLVDADIAPGAAVQAAKVLGTLPAGGTAGQSLVKSSAADYAAAWQTSGSVGSTNQLDYAQITANVAISATTEATANTVITGNSVVYDGSRVQIVFSVGHQGTNAASYVILRDSTVLGTFGDKAATSGATTQVYGSVFDTPPAGAHTYSLKAYAAAAGDTVWAGPGGSGQQVPGYLRVTKDPVVGPTGPQGPKGDTGSVGVAQSVTNASQLPASPAAGALAFLAIPGEGAIPVLYDGTISKWVTHPFRVWEIGQSSVTPFSWSSSGIIEADTQNFPWMQRISQPFRVWDVAGFKLQHRTRGLIKAAANTNAVIYVSYATMNVNAAPSGYTRFTTGGIGIGNFPFTLKDSGWVDPSAYPTVADHILPSFQYTSTGGIGGPAAHSVYCDFRWVA